MAIKHNENGYDKGHGTQSDPYLIYTAEQLNHMRRHTTSSFRLESDIDLAGWKWMPICEVLLGSQEGFRGHLDGNNHVIWNLTINRPEDKYLGLFARIRAGSVKNLGMRDGNIVGSEMIGFIAGDIYGSTITNCYNTGSIMTTDGSTGGIVGAQYANTLEYPFNRSEIKNCFNTGVISGGMNTGGIVGYSNRMTSTGSGLESSSCLVTACFNSGSIVSTETDWYEPNNTPESSTAGGIAGFNGGILENCYNTGSVTGQNAIGGIAGKNGSCMFNDYYDPSKRIILYGNILNCYNAGEVKITPAGPKAIGGGIVGIKAAGEIDDCVVENCADNYEKSKMEKIVGDDNGIITNVVRLKDSEFTAASALTTGGLKILGSTFTKRAGYTAACGCKGVYYPELKAHAESSDPFRREMSMLSATASLTTSSGVSCDPRLESVFEDGSGTAGDPYIITTAEQLNHVRRHSDSNYVLANDIDLSGWNPAGGNLWTPIAAVGGAIKNIVFDGGGFTVKNINVDVLGSNAGLLGTIDGCEIKNLNIIGGSVKSTSSAASLAGAASGSPSIITDCVVSADVTGGGFGVGGIIGNASAEVTITDCVNSGDIKSSGDGAGGLVGNGKKTTLNNCENQADVTGSGSVGSTGGLAGYALSIKNSGNYGSVTGTQNTGGLVGTLYGSIIDCYNAGNTKGSGNNVGGLAGTDVNSAASGSEITKSYNMGEVVGGGENTGGLIGMSRKTPVAVCHNMGAVSGKKYTGGIGGYSYASINDCFNMGTVTGTDTVGGIAGYAFGNVMTCINAGEVKGESLVCGIAGYSGSYVGNCINSADVSAANKASVAYAILADTMKASSANPNYRYRFVKINGVTAEDNRNCNGTAKTAAELWSPGGYPDSFRRSGSPWKWDGYNMNYQLENMPSTYYYNFYFDVVPTEKVNATGDAKVTVTPHQNILNTTWAAGLVNGAEPDSGDYVRMRQDSSPEATVIVMPNGNNYLYLSASIGGTTVTARHGPYNVVSTLSITGPDSFPDAVFGYAQQAAQEYTIENLSDNEIKLSVLTSSYFTVVDEDSYKNYTLPGRGTLKFSVRPNENRPAGTHNSEIIVSYSNVTATKDISFTVTKAEPVITWPAASDITYGQTLGNSVLSGGSGSGGGTFKWADPSLILPAGTRNVAVVFEPGTTGKNNYDYTGKTLGEVSVTVAKGKIVVEATPYVSKIYGEPDPAFAYNLASGYINLGGNLTGNIARAPGENAGEYAYTIGTLTAENYDVELRDTGRKFTIFPATPVMTLSAEVDNTDPANTMITLKASLTGVGSGFDTPSGTVTFKSSGTNQSIGSGSIDGNGECSITIQTTNLGVSTSGNVFDLSAEFGGGGNYDRTHTEISSFDCGKTSPAQLSITNGAITKTYGDSPIQLSTTGGSASGAVSYTSSDDSIVRIEGDTAVITGAGTAYITAYKEGDQYHNPSVSAPVTVTIDKKQASASGTLVDTKTYDGNKSATVTNVGTLDGYSIVGGTGGDDYKNLTLDTWAEFPSADAGDYNNGTTPVIVHYSLSGAAAKNYLTPLDSTAASRIDKKRIESQGAIAEDKVYDGNDTAVIIDPGYLTGVLAADIDEVELTGVTGRFFDADANATAAPKTVYVSLTITGTKSANYDGSSLGNQTGASITPKPLSFAAGDEPTVKDKVYDGNTDAEIDFAGTLSGVVQGDENDVRVDLTAEFGDSSVGTGKTVNVEANLQGNKAHNYIKPPDTVTAADITRKQLTVTGTVTAEDKGYDGTTAAVISSPGTLAGVEAGDNITLFATGEFDDETIANGKTVTVTFGLSGADTGNYLPPPGTTTTASITAKSLSVMGVSVYAKAYDGKTDAVIYEGQLVGAAPGDDVEFTASGAFPNANSGEKQVTVSFNISGSDTAKYLPPAPVTVTAEIQKTPLTVTADNKSRIYGAGNPNFTVKISGFVNGENESVLNALPTATCTADATSESGNYAIIPSGGAADNYSFIYINGTLTVGTDKGELGKLITQARGHLNTAVIGEGSGEYKQPVYNAFNTAIGAAEAVYNNANAAQSAIISAYSALSDAIELFIRSANTVDTSRLEAMIMTAKDKKNNATYGEQNGDYPPSQETALGNAVTDAESVLNKQNVTPTEVEAACDALQLATNTFNNSRVTVRYLELNNLIGRCGDVYDNAVEGSNVGEFESGSKAVFLAAIDSARQVADNDRATQAEVDTARNELNTALETFSGKVIGLDLSILRALINQAKDKLSKAVFGNKNGDYPEESKNALEEAIVNAENLLNAATSSARSMAALLTVTQQDINDAVAELDAAVVAFDNSRVVVSYVSLGDLISNADNTMKLAIKGDGNGQTPDAAWTALEDAINNSAIVANNNYVSQQDVNNAFSALNRAIDEFNAAKVIVDFSELDTRLAEAKAIARGNYTGVTWNALQAAIADAETVRGTQYVTQTAVDAEVAALANAIAGLISSGGGSSTVYYAVVFETNGGSKIETKSVANGGSVPKPADPVKDNFVFTGWYSGAELTVEYDFNAAVTGNLTLYAGWAKIELPFINGYPDGTFGPDNSITRAETAQILYNMLAVEETGNLSALQSVTDLNSSHWAANALIWAMENGYFNGYEDNTIRPDRNITRAELSAVLHRVALKENLFGEVGMANVSFNDIDGSWAYGDIMALAVKGIIKGYPDGSFGPDNAVTRVEAVVMIARLFGRSDEFGEVKSFIDVPKAHWAYANIMNAANGAYYSD